MGSGVARQCSGNRCLARWTVGSPIVAAEAEQVERTRSKTWSRARSEVLVPYRPVSPENVPNQVSLPADGLDSSSRPPSRASRANSKKDLVKRAIRGFCAPIMSRSSELEERPGHARSEVSCALDGLRHRVGCGGLAEGVEALTGGAENRDARSPGEVAETERQGQTGQTSGLPAAARPPHRFGEIRVYLDIATGPRLTSEPT